MHVDIDLTEAETLIAMIDVASGDPTLEWCRSTAKTLRQRFTDLQEVSANEQQIGNLQARNETTRSRLARLNE